MYRLITGVVISGICITQTLLSSNSLAIAQQNPQRAIELVEITKDHCFIPGLYGSLPRQIGINLKQFHTLTSSIETLSVLRPHNSNCMLLHGPSGNGKTTIARKFAELSNSRLIALDAPGIVTKYQNSGAEEITKLADTIEQHLETSTQPLVVFIGEIDALTSPGEHSNHVDTDRAMQRLWLLLSHYEQYPEVFFIFDTNRPKALPKPFLNRFSHENIIEIDNPSYEQRRLLLHSFLTYHALPLLHRTLFNRYLKKILNRGLGSFAHYAIHINALHNNLFLLDDHMKLRDKRTIDYINELTKQTVQIMDQLQERLRVSSNTSVLKDLAMPKDLHKAITTYCMLASGYLKAIASSADTSSKLAIDPTLLQYVAEKAQGLSNRALQTMALTLHNALQAKIPLTQDILDTYLHIAHKKLKIEDAEGERKHKDELLKDLQITDLKERQLQKNNDEELKKLQKEELEDKKKQRSTEEELKTLQLEKLKLDKEEDPKRKKLLDLQIDDAQAKKEDLPLDRINKKLQRQEGENKQTMRTRENVSTTVTSAKNVSDGLTVVANAIENKDKIVKVGKVAFGLARMATGI